MSWSERHAIVGVEFKQLWRDGGPVSSRCLDAWDADEKGRSDLLLGSCPSRADRQEGAELIERMEGCTLDVFGK